MSALRPSRILVHPVWWVALAVLIANDHVFKGSGLLPAEITGKLSDFVGLLVAPAILAVLCQVRTVRGFARSHLAVALGFAAINVSPLLAGWVEAATAPTPFPWAITVDPTDLIALPMVALSWALFLPWSAAPAPMGRVLGRAGFGLGMLACVATSPPPPGPGVTGPQPQPPVQPQEPQLIFPTADAQLMLANETGLEIRVRVRQLRSDVQVDCGELMRDPARRFDEDWFGPAELWSVEAGRAIPLRANGCRVLLVDGTELPRRLVVTQNYNLQQHSTEAQAVQSQFRVSVQAPSGSLAWGSHPALMELSTVHEEAGPACQVVPDGFGVTWSAAPVGERLLLDIKTAPDGCTAFDFEPPTEQAAPIRWFVCAPIEMPFAADDMLSIRPFTMGANGALEGVEVQGSQGRIIVSRGNTVPAIDVTAVQPQNTDCPLSFSCGLRVPMHVQLNHAEGPATAATVGETIELGNGELTIVRAEQRLAVDGRCGEDQGTLNPFLIESVFVENF